MIRRLLAKHPEYDVLSRHADGELPPSEAMEINGHLAECEECRDEVDFMVELRARLRGLDNPPLPRTMLPEILSLRAQGERKILDQGEPPEVRERSRVSKGAVTSGIAVGLTALGLALFAPGETEAGASSLVFEPRTDGTSTPFVFETSGVHADAASLRARGEFLTHLNGPWDPGVPSIVEVELERAKVGRFEGRRTLPAGITYARFVVETPAGEVIDGQRSWEHLERTPEGLPTFDALLTKLNVEVAARNFPAALATSERLTDRYPSRPEAWTWRHFVEGQAFGEVREAALREHRNRLAGFMRDLPETPSTEHLGALAWYAAQLGDDAASDQLGAHLRRMAPTHRVAGSLRVWDAFENAEGDLSRFLEALEEEWGRFGLTTVHVPKNGLDIAVELGDLDAALRWADRWVAVEPWERHEAALWLADLPMPSLEIVGRLRDALRWLDEGGIRRPVGQSRSLHGEDVEETRRDLWRDLGEQLLALGEREAGARALARGAESGWSPALFERLAELALEEGEEGEAARYLALLAADPSRTVHGGGADAEERLEALVAAPGARATLLEWARADLGRRLFARQDVHRWRGPVELASGVGVARRLGSELGERATIVHFWSPLSASTAEVPVATAGGCERWTAVGVRVLAIATDPGGPGAASPAETPAGCGEVWFVDVSGAARSALEARTIRETLVLDEDGTVLLRTTRPERARRAAAFLATDTRD